MHVYKCKKELMSFEARLGVNKSMWKCLQAILTRGDPPLLLLLRILHSQKRLDEAGHSTELYAALKNSKPLSAMKVLHSSHILMI
jgi:hypothetical protein